LSTEIAKVGFKLALKALMAPYKSVQSWLLM
jgi:hypothetical protein